MPMELRKQAAACWEKAAQCERQALLVEDATHRKTYRELAQLWQEMAQQSERLNDLFAKRQRERELPKRALDK